MKKFKALIMVMLCVALLAFAGCGTNNANENAGDGTVREETMNSDNTENSSAGDDGSAADRVKDDAKDAADDVKDAADDVKDGVKDAVDGNDNGR